MRQGSFVRSILIPIACAAAVLPLGCKAGVIGTPGTDAATDRSTPPREAGHDAIVPDVPKVDPDAACSSEHAGAEPVPLALYMMMDSSRSMLNTTTNNKSKWTAVNEAMSGFFSNAQSAGTAVGLAYFPAEQPGLPVTCSANSDCPGTGGACDFRNVCVTTGTVSMASPVFFCGDNSACKSTETCARLQTCTSSPYCETGGTATCPADCTIVAGYCNQRDVCDDNVYATPVVPIAPLPGAATALLASLSAHTPDGYTPTAPALRGAIKQAQQYAVAHPEYKVAVVLVTDGLPGGFTDVYQMGTLVRGYQHAACEPLDIPGIAKLASDAASPPAGSTNPPIPTFVIGVFSDAEASAGVVQPKLDTLASNGGTGSAVIINTNSDVTTALQTALNKIRTTAIACEYKIPPPTSGNIDFMKVNVTFTAGNGTVTTLGYGKDAAACGTKVGWHYDVDPNAGNGNPSSIVICDDNCKQFQSDSAGHVDFQLGCETIIIP